VARRNRTVLAECKGCGITFQVTREHRKFHSKECSRNFFRYKYNRLEARPRKYEEFELDYGEEVPPLQPTQKCDSCTYLLTCDELVKKELPVLCLPVTEIDIALAASSKNLEYYIEVRPQIRVLFPVIERDINESKYARPHLQ